ncbi:MAG: hypothetical protein WD847_20945 [Pirellulales bacterium]
MKFLLSLHLAALIALMLVLDASAGDEAKKQDDKAKAKAPASQPAIEPVLTNLSNPCGIAIHPATGDLFVSDSASLQVVRVAAKTHKCSPVITGFPKDVYGKGPMYDIGPLGLAFVDDETLVVGGGGHVDGQELLQIYTVPKPGTSIKAEQAKYTLGPITPGDDSLMGEGNFYGLAVDEHGIYISSNGDDTKGWVLKVELSSGVPGPLKPFIKTKVATGVDGPVGITLNKQGKLVVGQMGEINIPKDSLLTIYDAQSGEMLANAETDLYDIADLAYSPKSGKLYAIDFAWMDESQGGLFRLDVTGDGSTMKVKPVKIVSLDKPAAMAFAPSGVLYVCEFGTAEEGSKEKPGRVVAIRGNL